ncbi:uncharacterized protein PpBr36_06543 [Pyricularia pennisetigena]|uniref:uncharacterized protein n=1 Tax=Pyricularia pennisetigena TaxID=1578925 RepID=UPI001152FAC4|nr:uncharacterized protein PpBr36_06543 [Pyricularia pennisetigena]TLS23459.1 hypothetical protein PpBr36_06543 [Pyricularia pennisetigena]
MHPRASLKHIQPHFSIDSQDPIDSTDEQPSLPTQEAPRTNSPATPTQAHLSDGHQDPIEQIQNRYEGDRLVSYYKWQLHDDDDYDKGDYRARSRSAASPWQDQEAPCSMAATRRRELANMNRRINKRLIGCGAALVLVIVGVIVVFVV